MVIEYIADDFVHSTYTLFLFLRTLREEADREYMTAYKSLFVFEHEVFI